MCRYSLPNAIVLDNITQFAGVMVIYFCKDLGMHTKFVYVVHPQINRQAESANNVILKGLNKKLDDTNGLWADLLHEILWSYHTTPLSTTKETLFCMVYGEDAMLPIEINTLS